MSAFLPFFLLVACHPSTTKDTSVEWPVDPIVSTVDDIPTVIRVAWQQEGVTAARILYGPDRDYGHEVTVDLSTAPSYDTLVLGTPSGTEVHVRVEAETASGTIQSGDHVILTGPSPAAYPNLDITESGDHWQGYLVTDLVSQPALVIVDAEGNYVWWYDVGAMVGVTGGIALGRTALARDGRSVLFEYINIEGMEYNPVFRIGLDGEYVDAYSLPWSHHDFVELDDGTLAYLAYDVRDVAGDSVLGDRIMEYAPDGTIREVWNVWDHYEYDPKAGPEPGLGWPHANALDYLPDDDAYLIGFIALEAVVKVDRATGETLWTLGGTQSDYTLPDGGTGLFNVQHQFEWLDGSLVTFVNGGTGPDAASYAVEYELDDTSMTATPTWMYQPESSLYSTNLGDVDRLDSGNTLVTFSICGEIHEVTPAGDVVWQLSAGVAGALGYATLVDDLNAP